MKPKAAFLRTYQVGFGDCLLLRLDYGDKFRNVLFDFGTTKRPEAAGKDHMTRVAEDIVEITDGKIDVLVVTHRHADHNSGFGGESGKLMAGLDIGVVVQPWTEDPALASNATGPGAAKHHRRALDNMNRVAGNALEVATRLAGTRRGAELAELAANNQVSPATRAITKLTGERAFVSFGAPPKSITSRLPGVAVHVLGPPTLDQTDSIRKQRSRDPDEFWSLRADRWQAFADSGFSGQTDPFGDDVRVIAEEALPPHTRWICNRIRRATDEMAFELVRTLDHAMNNTSVIVLLQVGDAALLFPGDAQIENWQYALEQPGVLDLLSTVTVYKVGHHGSLNATPRTVWNQFRKSAKDKARLKTFLSTLAGKHGHVESRTEVPRSTLVKALDASSTLTSTEEYEEEQLFTEVSIPL